MYKKEQRRIAIGAARAEMRSVQQVPEQATFDDVLSALNEMSLRDKNLIASQWYLQASDNQIKLARKEWAAWKKQQAWNNRKVRNA